VIELRLDPSRLVAGKACPVMLHLRNVGPGVCTNVRLELRPERGLSVVSGARTVLLDRLRDGDVHDHAIELSSDVPGPHVLTVRRLEYVDPDGLHRGTEELAVDVEQAPPPPAPLPAPLHRGSIFISYRKADSGAAVDRLSVALEAAFPGYVFRDQESLWGGDDWEGRIFRELRASAVVLVIVGPQWLTLRDEDRILIEKEDDVLRREIATALEDDLDIIPVLVDGALPPREGQLPAPLKPLSTKQFHTLAPSRQGIDDLVDHVRHVMGE
jgi:hypothetical protein